VRFELDLFLKIRKVADQDINTPSIYLYLIIKYVRFPSLTKFLRLIYSITKLHITTYATDKFKKNCFVGSFLTRSRAGAPSRYPCGIHLWPMHWRPNPVCASASNGSSSYQLRPQNRQLLKKKLRQNHQLSKKTETESSPSTRALKLCLDCIKDVVAGEEDNGRRGGPWPEAEALRPEHLPSRLSMRRPQDEQVCRQRSPRCGRVPGCVERP
jgi:hypothetical protein